MAKKFISPKKLRKLVRKNPYATGIALLALGGVAAATRRGQLGNQLRALKAGVVRRLSAARSETVAANGMVAHSTP